MHSFENIISIILQSKGYWVISAYKVNLTKDEKKKIGKSSAPRWEIDLIAYNPRRNELLIVECKSYLDSKGVQVRNGLLYPVKSYKLFNGKKLYSCIRHRIILELKRSGMILSKPKVKLCLFAGKIASGYSRREIPVVFRRNGWLLYDERKIVMTLKEVSETKYFDDPVYIASKLIFRNPIIGSDA